MSCQSDRRKSKPCLSRARATIRPRNIASPYTRYMMYCISTYFSLFLWHTDETSAQLVPLVYTIYLQPLHHFLTLPPSAGLLTHTSSFSPHHPIHHASSFGFFLFCFFAESCAYNVIGLSLPLSPSQGSSCIKSSFPPCFALLIWPCRPE